MFGGVLRIFSFRGAGVAWALATAVLAVALVASGLQARRTETFLRAKIATLASHDASQLQAELVSCRASVRSYAAALSAATPRAVAPEPHATRAKNAVEDAGSAAAELVSNPPAGIDVCARMESADQAVLKALDRR